MKSINKIKIRGYHIDQSNHVNNARYLEFLEEGRWSYIEENNLFGLFLENGIGHVTVNINVNYRKSAFLGNVLGIETDLMRKGGKSITMKQTIFLKDTHTVIADAEVTNVFFYEKSGETVPVDEHFISLWPELERLPDITKPN